MLASELYAQSQGASCSGPDNCHWCGACCERSVPHDDPPPQIGVRRLPALRPGSSYVCVGCQRFRRRQTTVWFLDGSFLDSRPPEDFGWLVTETSCRAVRPVSADAALLYQTLLKPPLRFCLALLDGRGGVRNLLQLMVVNVWEKVNGDTPLGFTLNNVPHAYTVYQLEEALRHGVEGKSPGVRVLVSLFGPYKVPGAPDPSKQRGKGRPPKNFEEPNPLLRTVTPLSGSVALT